jgi:hypothetical protein
MNRPKPDTLDFLLQSDVIEELLPSIGKQQWQILHLSADDYPHRLGMWSAFLNEEAVNRAMSRDGWDFMRGDGKPGFSKSWSGEKEVITYNRFGDDDGFRPLVLYRSFYGAFPQYVELDEEFRLYHDLAEDKERGLLLLFDASGREIEVVRITLNEVHARLKYLRQFQAGTGLYLVIYLDSVRYSKISIDSVPTYEHQLVDSAGMIRWRRDVAECDFMIKEYKTFSRLLGKIILPPPIIDKAGIWPFEDDSNQREVKFIVGVDEDGNEIEPSSDPDKLYNYTYLTPIYFRREVLAKYFAEPERYKVSDGRLSCLNLWSCQIDNDLESYVVVFLGDLGRDLPYDEQLHWRQFNVPPEGGVSETNFRRSFLNQFTDPQSPDLTFRHLYVTINRNWEEVFGWPLFLPPSPGDEYLLDTVRIPVTNSQVELDQQIGHLTKLIVDSLNEKELTKGAGPLEEDTKGIGKLDGFLATTQFPERETVIQLLRDLQSLRSTGSAHRKGSGYQKIIAKLGVDPKNKPDAVRRLLEEIIAALRALRIYYCGEREDLG